MSTPKLSDLNVASIFRLCLRNWYWFALSLFCCCGLALAYVMIHKPKYQLNANILIAKSNDDLMSMMPDVGAFSGMLGIKSSVDDELLILQSRSLMAQVVKEMGLNRNHVERHGLFNLLKDFKYDDYAIDVMPVDPAMLDTLSTQLKFKISVNDKGAATAECFHRRKTIGEAESSSLPMTLSTRFGDFIISRTAAAPKGESLRYDVYLYGNNIAAELIQKDVTIDVASKKSNIINIGLRHFDVEYGKDLIDHLMDSYNERGLDDKNLRAEKTIEFVDKRINVIAGDLADVEDSIKIFLNQEGLVNIQADLKYQVEMRGEIEASLLQSEIENEVTKMLEDFLTDPVNANALMPTTTAIDPEVLKAYNDQILYRMRLERDAKGNNTALQSTNEAIAAMRASILESVRKSRQASEISVRDQKAKQRENDSKISRMPEQTRAMVDLQRNRAAKERILAMLIQQREQAAIQIANAIPKGTIIDQTYSNYKSIDMSPMIILALALLFGLALPPAFYYVRSMMRNTIENEEDVTTRSELDVDAVIPYHRGGEPLVVGNDIPSDADTEPFRKLRSNVESAMKSADGGNIVTVTAAHENVGTSFVALNLASSMALAGKRVLLVDLNLRKPSQAASLHMASAPGVTDAVATGNPERMVQDVAGEPRLSLLSAGTPTRHPGDLIASPAFAAMMETLKDKFDCIVCDTAPVADISDTLPMGPLSAATLFVVDTPKSHVRDLSVAEGLEASHEFKNVAIVINTSGKSRKA